MSVGPEQVGQRWTGITAWPRFIIQSLRVVSPIYHAFAALLYSYALVFNSRGDEQLPSSHQSAAAIDFSSWEGWKRFVVEAARDSRDAAVQLYAHLSPPLAAATPTVDGLSDSLLDSDHPNHLLHTAKADSSSGRSRLTSVLLSFTYVLRSLVACPFYFLRWYFTPVSFRSVFYRLTVRALIMAALYGMPLNIERAFGPQAYFDRIGQWLEQMGVRQDIVAGVNRGWVSFFLFREAYQRWVELLLLAVWCRPSKVRAREAELRTRSKEWRQQPGAMDNTGGVNDEQEPQQQQQAVEAEATNTSADVPDDAPPPLFVRSQSWLRSSLQRRPSVLWLWVIFYVPAILLPALFNVFITLEWSRTWTYQYYSWFEPRHKTVLYASLFPVLFIEHCLHVRGEEHARAFPESTVPWYQQSRPLEHSHQQSDAGGRAHGGGPCASGSASRLMCSCHLVRLFVLAVVASWCFNDMLAMLMTDYGAVSGEDSSIWLYYDITWRVVSFYATVMMWKLAVRWAALSALPGVTSVVPVFAIQLMEDVWSFLFFTSCSPFSPAFFLVCTLHFIKTLGRDLNVPFWLSCVRR